MAIDFKNIEEEIKSHMENQPYKCTCENCGSDVELDVSLDGDLDMIVTVPICKCATVID